MNDLSIYFKPCISEDLAFEEEQMGQILQSNYGDFPEIEPDSIAIFSVPELNYFVQNITKAHERD